MDLSAANRYIKRMISNNNHHRNANQKHNGISLFHPQNALISNREKISTGEDVEKKESLEYYGKKGKILLSLWRIIWGSSI